MLTQKSLSSNIQKIVMSVPCGTPLEVSYGKDKFYIFVHVMICIIIKLWMNYLASWIIFFVSVMALENP
jgi:hypothetical protein